MTRAMLVLLALLGMAGCASDPGARRADGTCPLIRLAEMPLEVRGNMLFVQAKIGEEPVTLLVDTGAERTLLTEAAVDRLRLPRDLQHATRTFGIGSPTATWDARLPNGIGTRRHAFPGGQRYRRPLRHRPAGPAVRRMGCWAPTSCWRSTSIWTCPRSASRFTAPGASAPRPRRRGTSPTSPSRA